MTQSTWRKRQEIFFYVCFFFSHVENKSIKQVCVNIKNNAISNWNVKSNTMTSFFLLFLHVALTSRVSYKQKFLFVRKHSVRVNVTLYVITWMMFTCSRNVHVKQYVRSESEWNFGLPLKKNMYVNEPLIYFKRPYKIVLTLCTGWEGIYKKEVTFENIVAIKAVKTVRAGNLSCAETGILLREGNKRECFCVQQYGSSPIA